MILDNRVAVGAPASAAVEMVRWPGRGNSLLDGIRRFLKKPASHLGIIALITFGAVSVHGYHLGSDDAAIYVPAIKKAADPGLYPFGSEFFMNHASLSLFADLIGGSARLTRVPVDFTIFFWHVASVFLLLLASRQLACVCFYRERARWAAVGLVAGVLSVPVAGTALVIMDPYITARSLSTPASLFAVAAFAASRPKWGLLWLAATVLVHPQMGVYAAACCVCLELARYFARRPLPLALSPKLASLAVFPLSFQLEPARGAYREALFSRSYFFVSNWTWYEWAGVFAPLALLVWFSEVAADRTSPAFRLLCRTLVPFGLIFTAAAVLLDIPERFQNLLRIQPMRSFHLVYVVFFVLLGGLIGEYFLRDVAWRWAGLFLVLGASMGMLQESTFPSSPHVEWPDAASRNPWCSAFLWVRANTPEDAIFALDPNYLGIAGEDQHGFRAIAERSALADNLKDSGAVSVFPQLAGEWKTQVLAQRGWRHFKLADFESLAERYKVGWVVLQRPTAPGLSCQYQNEQVSVCRIDARSAFTSAP